MEHSTMASSLMRDSRAAAGLIGAGSYVVGGWLLLSRLLAGVIAPIDTCICAEAAPRPDGGARALKVLIVLFVDGPTYNCLVPAHLVSADEIVVTSGEFDAIWRMHGCA
jgi:hypothetical protein